MLWLHPRLIKLQARRLPPAHWPYSHTLEEMLQFIAESRCQAAAFLRYYRRLPKEKRTGKMANKVWRVRHVSHRALKDYLKMRYTRYTAPRLWHQLELPLWTNRSYERRRRR